MCTQKLGESKIRIFVSCLLCSYYSDVLKGGGVKREVSFRAKVRLIGRVAAILGFLILLGGSYNHHHLIHSGPNGSWAGELLEQNYTNIGTELIFAAFTLLIIQELLQEDQLQERKKILLEKLASNENQIANGALLELRGLGHHLNGTLSGISINGANLQRANFKDARMEGTVFIHCNLRSADFSSASCAKCHFIDCEMDHAVFVGANMSMASISSKNCEHADFSNAIMQGAAFSGVSLRASVIDELQLRSLSSLRHAKLPNGNKYNGRFGLEGDTRDYEEAKKSDPALLQHTFFSVSPKVYEAGQIWYSLVNNWNIEGKGQTEINLARQYPDGENFY